MLRSEGSLTSPPKLRCQMNAPDEVVVVYDSPRKMCPLAKGIITGVAKHYGERVAIAEPRCMLKGASECQLVVNVLQGSA
jgi:predicted hydrocarbon binding protein